MAEKDKKDPKDKKEDKKKTADWPAKLLWISILGVTGFVFAGYAMLCLFAGNLLSAGVMLLISWISSYAFYLEARSS